MKLMVQIMSQLQRDQVAPLHAIFVPSVAFLVVVRALDVEQGFVRFGVHSSTKKRVA